MNYNIEYIKYLIILSCFLLLSFSVVFCASHLSHNNSKIEQFNITLKQKSFPSLSGPIEFNSHSFEIPKVIISTYHTKEYIPFKVFDNINKYAVDYKYIIFDDNDIIEFLRKYYKPEVLETFNTLSMGAHKADLFRYCYLYEFGGIYLDIKTELIKDIDTIFNKKSINLYTVICNSKECIYQGIIATVPKNPIFIDLINHILISVKTPLNIKNNYLIFTKYFYDRLKEIYGLEKLINGKMVSLNLNTYLFNEECTINLNDCNDGLDRYGLCCYAYDNGVQIIKIRYPDYPWMGVAN